MSLELETGTRHAIGPLIEMHGHGPVTAIDHREGYGPGGEYTYSLVACLDCGYVTDDKRMLYHVECDREKNPINRTWRELAESIGVDETVIGRIFDYPAVIDED